MQRILLFRRIDFVFASAKTNRNALNFNENIYANTLYC